ncbi:hypothetical protein [Streptomyces sp. NPDC101455]|uniref:hypothetical protein n=1 Tax=Streptomyces sp. NPDC101455 TaxID=3366142 RepID=UPI0037FE2AEB
MTASSQTPGPMPPESPPVATSEQAAEVFAAYGQVWPVPVGTVYAAPVAPVSVEEAAAAEVLDAVRAQNADATSLELAAAEARAGILFDAAHVQEAVGAAVAQAHTETQAELAELHTQLAMLAGAHRRVRAVLRLCEGRRGDDLVLVSAVAVAAECGTTALDGLPMTLSWTRSAQVPDAHTTRKVAIVECTSSYGGRADLVLVGDERQALVGLLTTEVRDIHAKCLTLNCGTGDDLDATNPFLFGWSRLQVAALGDGPRWYCSDMCVFDALARAGHELAAEDRAAAVDPGGQAYDEASYLDTRYGQGASDEYALQVAEAHEAGVEDERGDVDDQAHMGGEG